MACIASAVSIGGIQFTAPVRLGQAAIFHVGQGRPNKRSRVFTLTASVVLINQQTVDAVPVVGLLSAHTAAAGLAMPMTDPAPSVQPPSGTVNFVDLVTGAVLGTASLSDGTATLNTTSLKAGNYQIVAQYSGNRNYSHSAATPLTQSILPTNAKPSITVTDAGGTYDGAAFPATFTVAGLVSDVDDTPASSLEGVTPLLKYYSGSSVRGTASTTAPTAPGTYTVTASFAGSTHYVATTSTPVTFTLGKATTTCSEADVGGSYNGSTYRATVALADISGATVSNLNGVSPKVTYYSGMTAKGRGSSTAPTKPGTYTAVASFGGSVDYTSAQSNSVTFTISKATITLDVTAPGGVYNGKTMPASVKVTGATSKSPLKPTVTYYVGESATGTGTTKAPKAPGTYTVVASYAGNSVYTAATSKAVTFTISQATPTLSVTTPGAVVGHSLPRTVSLIGISGHSSTSLDNIKPVLTYYVGNSVSGSGSHTAPTAIGAYTVVASFAGSKNYTATESVPVTFTITSSIATLTSLSALPSSSLSDAAMTSLSLNDAALMSFLAI